MRPQLGPPRELVVRRLHSDHRRAKLRLVEVATIGVGVLVLAIAIFDRHERVGWRVVMLIDGVAILAARWWRLVRPSRGNLIGQVILIWTMLVAAYAVW